MSLQHRKAYFVADIEPVIAVAETARWERETITQPRPERLFAHDLMKQARAERSAYQQELIRRFAAFVGSLFASPRQAVAKPRMRR